MQHLISHFVLLWAVIDPIGTIPVFIHATRKHSAVERRHIAATAAFAAAGILIFFIFVGETVLNAMGVPIPAFQIAGGIVLFLFALTMIFGEAKAESEAQEIRKSKDVAIFPLATPSIASPGAMMAVVLLTQKELYSIDEQLVTTVLMITVVATAYVLMLLAGPITRVIGESGANIISRVMGMLLASVAATEVLAGLKEYFS